MQQNRQPQLPLLIFFNNWKQLECLFKCHLYTKIRAKPNPTKDYVNHALLIRRLFLGELQIIKIRG